MFFCREFRRPLRSCAALLDDEKQLNNLLFTFQHGIHVFMLNNGVRAYLTLPGSQRNHLLTLCLIIPCRVSTSNLVFLLELCRSNASSATLHGQSCDDTRGNICTQERIKGTAAYWHGKEEAYSAIIQSIHLRHEKEQKMEVAIRHFLMDLMIYHR